MPLDDSLARLGREIGDMSEQMMFRREGVPDFTLRRLSWELDMLKHALYLNRNEPLFRMVRDGLKWTLNQ